MASPVGWLGPSGRIDALVDAGRLHAYPPELQPRNRVSLTSRRSAHLQPRNKALSEFPIHFLTNVWTF
jgi:hypothetical protein